MLPTPNTGGLFGAGNVCSDQAFLLSVVYSLGLPLHYRFVCMLCILVALVRSVLMKPFGKLCRSAQFPYTPHPQKAMQWALAKRLALIIAALMFFTFKVRSPLCQSSS